MKIVVFAARWVKFFSIKAPGCSYQAQTPEIIIVAHEVPYIITCADGLLFLLPIAHLAGCTCRQNLCPGDCRCLYLGIDECKKTVLEIFEYHNDKIKSQIGKDYSIATHKKLSTHSIILQVLSRQSTSVQICSCMR